MTAERGDPPLPRWWRPGLVAALHLSSALVGVAVAGPGASLVARLAGRLPGVDATLFDHGGLLAAEVLRSVLAEDLRGLAWRAAAAAGAGALVGCAVTAGVLSALAAPEPRGLAATLAAALRATPALVAILSLTLVGRLAIAAALGSAGHAALASLALAPPVADLAVVGGLLALVALDGLVCAFADLARASAAAHRRGLFEALGDAARALGRHPLGLPAAYGARAVTAHALAVAAGLLAVRVGMRGAGAAAGAAALLELSLLAGTCLRLSWLALAVRATAAPATSALPGSSDSTTDSAAEPR